MSSAKTLEHRAQASCVSTAVRLFALRPLRARTTGVGTAEVEGAEAIALVGGNSDCGGDGGLATGGAHEPEYGTISSSAWAYDVSSDGRRGAGW